jgi:hypothetical protein
MLRSVSEGKDQELEEDDQDREAVIFTSHVSWTALDSFGKIHFF